MHSEGLQDATQSAYDRDFWLGRFAACACTCGGLSGSLVWLEACIVGESTIEIALDMFAVVVAEFTGFHCFKQLAVHVGMLGHEIWSARVPPPSCSSPLGWDTLANVPFYFVAFRREADRIVGAEAVGFHEQMPLFASPVQVLAVLSIPLVICLDADVMGRLLKTVPVSRNRSGNCRYRIVLSAVRTVTKTFACYNLRGSAIHTRCRRRESIFD